MTPEPDPISAALETARVLERLGIPYLIGGSVASTVHGEPRATADVDLAVHMDPSQVDGLASALAKTFFVDRGSIDAAVTRASSFNVVHQESFVKVDLFVRPREGIFAEEMRRAASIELSPHSKECARVATPEDTILQKLRWYRMGDEVSDRQWRDVQGVLKTTGPALDREYLTRWADELGLSDLLERAAAQAGLDSSP